MARVLDRLGRGSYRHRWIVLVAWLLVLAAAAFGAVSSGLHLSNSFSIPGTESDRAQALVAERLGDQAAGVGSTSASQAQDVEAPASARVVVAAPEGESYLTGTGIQDVMTALAPVADAPDVAGLSDPVTSQAVAPDGSVLYVDVQFTVALDDVPTATTDALEDAASTLEADGYEVALSGGPFTEPLELAGPTEALGLVVALVVLVVTFGSLLAAGMPILTALLGVGIGIAGVLSLSAVTDISSSTLTLALMLGLAVGIDYALFLLSRHRQQLADGMDPETSAGHAVGTAGSAVGFAGTTVVIALAALTVTGIPFLAAMGLAAAATVVIAVLVALTLLPAMMGFAGERLRPRGRALKQAEHSREARNRWGAFVTTHPIITLVAGALVLLIIAIPALSLRLGLPTAGREPEGSGDRRAYEMLAEGFGPGFNGPLVVLVDAQDDPSALADAVEAVTATVSQLPDVAYAAPVAAPGATEGADAALVIVIPGGAPDSPETADLVHAIRDARPGLEADTGTELWVTGASAANIDITEKLADAFPVFLLIVVGLAIVLLLVAFRSLLVPVTAVLGFLLTIAAAFGATTAVFQWGWLSGIFNVDSTGPLLSFLPILLVGVLFGLAMDYQVFLVSRMREEHVHGADATAAVRLGFAHGARVVLAAALIMISVFSSFVFSGSAQISPIAFALAIGILFDAIVVRMTLIPAAMTLLGKSAWYLPRWLDRIIPNVDIEGAALDRAGSHAAPAPVDEVPDDTHHGAHTAHGVHAAE
ncbi:MMPL family transporter [Cellulomonas humilata]|uniref:MMPL family transporter n=1 Tax=Cellulomonas humilata TaxID=144055 RepID=A0A7Y6DXU4_9CELL|nr:MMPL family transporter [Cellulomonas humilata]NUU17319.1 MMPL family transporter [Cellulomonas humilata]